MPSDNSISF
jgi:hypothetical protein